MDYRDAAAKSDSDDDDFLPSLRAKRLKQEPSASPFQTSIPSLNTQSKAAEKPVAESAETTLAATSTATAGNDQKKPRKKDNKAAKRAEKKASAESAIEKTAPESDKKSDKKTIEKDTKQSGSTTSRHRNSFMASVNGHYFQLQRISGSSGKIVPISQLSFRGQFIPRFLLANDTIPKSVTGDDLYAAYRAYLKAYYPELNDQTISRYVSHKHTGAKPVRYCGQVLAQVRAERKKARAEAREADKHKASEVQELASATSDASKDAGGSHGQAASLNGNGSRKIDSSISQHVLVPAQLEKTVLPVTPTGLTVEIAGSKYFMKEYFVPAFMLRNREMVEVIQTNIWCVGEAYNKFLMGLGPHHSRAEKVVSNSALKRLMSSSMVLGMQTVLHDIVCGKLTDAPQWPPPSNNCVLLPRNELAVELPSLQLENDAKYLQNNPVAFFRDDFILPFLVHNSKISSSLTPDVVVEAFLVQLKTDCFLNARTKDAAQDIEERQKFEQKRGDLMAAASEVLGIRENTLYAALPAETTKAVQPTDKSTTDVVGNGASKTSHNASPEPQSATNALDDVSVPEISQHLHDEKPPEIVDDVVMLAAPTTTSTAITETEAEIPGEAKGSMARHHDDPGTTKRRSGSIFGSYFPGKAGDGCILCTRSTHVAADCPDLTCSACGTRGVHFRMSCPKMQRCSKCLESGHSRSECAEKLLAVQNGCDRCGESSSHDSRSCPLLWRTYIPEEPVLKVRLAPVSCYNCGSNKHLGSECGIRRPKTSSGRDSTWSRQNYDKYHSLDSKISSVNDAAGIINLTREEPPKMDFSKKGKPKHARDADTDAEAEEDVVFLSAKVVASKKSGKIQVRTAGMKKPIDPPLPPGPPPGAPVVPPASSESYMGYERSIREPSYEPPPTIAVQAGYVQQPRDNGYHAGIAYYHGDMRT